MRNFFCQTLPFHVTGIKICQLPLFGAVSGGSSWWYDNDELKKEEISIGILPFLSSTVKLLKIFTEGVCNGLYMHPYNHIIICIDYIVNNTKK